MSNKKLLPFGHLEPPSPCLLGTRCRSPHISPTPARHRHQQHSDDMSTTRAEVPSPVAPWAACMTRSTTKTSSNKKRILNTSTERASKHTPSTFSLGTRPTDLVVCNVLQLLASFKEAGRLGWHNFFWCHPATFGWVSSCGLDEVFLEIAHAWRSGQFAWHQTLDTHILRSGWKIRCWRIFPSCRPREAVDLHNVVASRPSNGKATVTACSVRSWGHGITFIDVFPLKIWFALFALMLLFRRFGWLREWGARGILNHVAQFQHMI